MRREVYLPMRKSGVQSSEPLSNPRFPSVDLLATADKAYHYGPVLVSIKVRKQERGFRVPEIRLVLSPLHEA
jgi:hypothetical protein